MAFESPAQDYIESRLNLNALFIPHPENTFRVDTCNGFVLIDRAAALRAGDMIAFQYDGHSMLGKIDHDRITPVEGEAIQGEALEAVIFLGKMCCEVLKVFEPDVPI